MRISRREMLALVDCRFPSLRESGRRLPGLDVEVQSADLETLACWVRAWTTPPRVVTRSMVVLLAAAGWSNARVAAELGISRRTVALWKSRFVASGSAGLVVDRPGRGRKRGRDASRVARILAKSDECPSSGTRWTVRSLAEAVGVSHATVQRVWREHGIRPRVSPATTRF